MKTNLFLAVLCLVYLLTAACGYLEGESTGMNKVFADMENGIKNEDESLFKTHWHEEGYTEDLVGEGLTGERFYSQGSRKKWFPVPDYDGKKTAGKVEIIPAELYAWEKDRNVDEIYFAVAEGKILGGGEDLEKVRALAERFNAGNPLKP